MFYIRTRLSPDTEARIDITGRNVFCRCPLCGDEVPVDLTLFAGDEDFDIIGSTVMCEDCTRALLQEDAS